ncbi:MAG: NusA-like transcription termination signal-binding factor [Nanoarchaeota archaeon]|nr:NusA-like transcription termination signal-binding factor [Nanoarchaeota archaeon]MBU1269780.1 NusA-like transcription termination signal-binding factor [Nanoarchaeota archaeon]MBU1604372.1 NusA-like transcription termination signal-binding factor [Nanoarchaeota archaeon]MBU2443643.1 NusA-like transcription termination signal-binding factor [Nanoarchaeota archaeon]
MTIKYDVDLIQQISLFERVAQADVKECFYFKEKLTFMVESGQLGRALGKNKSKLIKLEDMFKKPIRIIEYNNDMKQFIVNLIAPLKVVSMTIEGNVVTITGPDTKTKGLMIGSKAKNLRETEEVVKKYFPDLKEIKVV